MTCALLTKPKPSLEVHSKIFKKSVSLAGIFSFHPCANICMGTALEFPENKKL